MSVTLRRVPLVLVALLLACPARQASHGPGGTSAALAGDWVGGYRIGKRYSPFALHLPAHTDVRPSFDLPAEGVRAATLTDYLPAGDALRFMLPGRRSKVALQGRLEHEALIGVARGEGQEGSFEMRRTMPVEPGALREYMGLYDAGAGHMVAFERMPELAQLHFTDFFSGRFNAIFPGGKDRFFAGPALLVAAPAVMVLGFSRDAQGAITSVTFQQDGEPDVVAVRVPIREAALEFKSDTRTLAGTLLAPATPGPHPAVVLVPDEHGAPRDAHRKDADFLVSQGFAAFIYDRRGVGASRGEASQVPVPALADDALAAVELLRGRADIERGRVGVWGYSQGGWVAALAGSRSPAVAFVINISTPTLPAAEQEIYRIEHAMRVDGFAGPQILEAVNYQRLLMDWIRDGTGRDSLVAVHRAAAAAPWASYVALPPSPLPDEPRAAAREFYRYDPLPAIAELRCPALFVYGKADSFVPVERSVPLIKTAMVRRSHPDTELKVLPRTGHGMYETDLDNRDALPLARRHGPGYWQLLGTWLAKARVSAPPEPMMPMRPTRR